MGLARSELALNLYSHQRVTGHKYSAWLEYTDRNNVTFSQNVTVLKFTLRNSETIY